MKLILKIFTVIVLVFSTHVFGTERVLSKSDVRLYKEAFSSIKKGNWKELDAIIPQIKDQSLIGYIHYKKYLSKNYKTSKKEIVSWLEDYGDLPIANEIYALGKQKNIKLTVSKPKGLFGGNACSYMHKVEPIDLIRNRRFTTLGSKKRIKAQQLMKKIVRHIEAGRTKNARLLIDSKEVKKLFPQEDLDAARTALAFSYFLDGRDDLALSFSEKALKNSNDIFPLAYWTAGLALWRQGNILKAKDYFLKVVEHDKVYPLLKSTAAFWAARAYLKLGKYKEVGNYLEISAYYPRTFYGILALRTLGSDLEHVWDIPSKPEDDVEADFSHPALERFYALKQIGQKELAQKELSQLYLNADKEGKGILLMISEENGFSKDLLLLAGELIGEDTRYPMPNWIPVGGWILDKALVYAFVRQESCFNQYAKSSVGAVGLMQIMPRTGKEIARQLNYDWSERKLHNTEYNLSIGQNYLKKLLSNPEINGNLIFTAVGYNAGPGNLAKWKKKMNYQNDPLLFIESIPSKETRGFVERIMVNYWVYLSLTDRSLKSLDEVVSGQWPYY